MVFAEKVIDPLAEELAKEDEFVPIDDSVIEVIISETSSWSFLIYENYLKFGFLSEI